MNKIKEISESSKKELAEDVMFNIRIAGLEDGYVKSKELESIWGMNDRQVRQEIESILHLYLGGYIEEFVIGTPNGYIISHDKEVLRRHLEAREKQWKAMCKNCYYLKKRLLNQDNYTINDYLKDNDI